MSNDRTVLVRLRANADQYIREMERAQAATKGVGDTAKASSKEISKATSDSERSMRKLGDEVETTEKKIGRFRQSVRDVRSAFGDIGRSIDTTNDRMAWMAQGFLALAPAAVPLAATIVPSLSALAMGATAAAGAVTTLLLGFNGIGDAMGALNDYQLEPTAQNLEKLQTAMADIGPEGVEFVRFLDQVGEQLSVLQTDARAGGMFSGMMDGIDSLMDRLPQVRDLVRQFSAGIGQLTREAGEGLGGDKFNAFFSYLQTDAQPIMMDFGRAIGNFAEGFANMLVEMGPLTSNFTGGLLDMSRGFAEWSRTLDTNQSFQDFISYIQESGPKVTAFVGALVDALVELARAAAPVGDVMLPILTRLLGILGDIASTPVGHFAVMAAAITSIMGRMKALSNITSGGVFGAFTKNSREAAASAKDMRKQMGTSLGEVVATWATAGTRTERESERVKGAIDNVKTSAKDMAKAYGPAAGQAAALAVAMTPIPEKLGLSNTAMGAMVGSVIPGWGTAIGAAAGFALDFATANSDVSDSLEKVRTGLEMGASAQQLQSDLAVAQQALKDLKADIEAVEEGGGFPGLDAILRQHKDEVEGWFGKSDTEEAEAALKEYEKQVAEVTQAEKQARLASLEASDGLQTLGRSAGMSDDELLANAGALKQVSTSAKTASNMFVDLTGAVQGNKVSFDGWINSIEKQAQATKNLRTNVAQLLQKGLNPKLIQDLVNQGQEGASVLETINNKGAGGVRKANKAFAALQRQLGLTDQQMRDLGLTAAGFKAAPKVETGGLEAGRQKINEVAAALRHVPTSVRTKLEADPGNSRKIVNDALKNLDLTERERRALITIRDNASPKAKIVQKALARLAKQKANPTVDLNTKPAERKRNLLERFWAGLVKKNPQLRVDANTKPADSALKGTGKNADNVGRKRPKVTVTFVDKASAGIAKLDAKINATDRKAPKVTVTADTGKATSGLETVESKAQAVDRLSPSVTISAVDNASGKISSVSSALTNLNGDEAVTYITTVKRTRKGSADGGTIERDGYAGGGSVRGTVPGPRMPYGDKITARLAPGEEVITNRNGEADRNRKELKAANAGAKLAVIGWAGGGSVWFGDEGDWDDEDEDYPGYASGGTAGRKRGGGKKGDGKKGKGKWKPKTPGLDKAIKATTDRLGVLNQALTKSQRTLDSETAARDALVSSVTSALEKDIWAAPEQKETNWNSTSTGPTQLTPAMVYANLKQQRAEAQEFDRIMTNLRKRGLNGGAFNEIAAGGLERARMFAGESRSELAAYERMFNSTNAAVSTAASRVGDTAATVRELQTLRNTVNNLTKQIRTNEARKEKLINKRETRREKLREKHAKDTGKAAGRAVGDNAKRGRRNRRR